MVYGLPLPFTTIQSNIYSQRRINMNSGRWHARQLGLSLWSSSLPLLLLNNDDDDEDEDEDGAERLRWHGASCHVSTCQSVRNSVKLCVGLNAMTEMDSETRAAAWLNDNNSPVSEQRVAVDYSLCCSSDMSCNHSTDIVITSCSCSCSSRILCFITIIISASLMSFLSVTKYICGVFS